MPDRFVPSSERRRVAADSARLLPTILFADASEEYRTMARDALLEGRTPSALRFVANGKELLDFLHRRGPYEDAIAAPRPALIVLDLALPQLAGLDAVRAIKSDAGMRRIPVIALTPSLDPHDVAAAYDAGVNTYLAKPVTFLALVKLMKVFTAYWLETAELPLEEAAA